MFDISGLELALIAAVAIMVFGPKELPGLLRQMGQMMGKARALSRQLRAGIDEMIRQAELEEMERRWREENARIMAAHPAPPEPGAAPGVPAAGSGADGPQPAAGPAAGAGDLPAEARDPFSGRPLRDPGQPWEPPADRPVDREAAAPAPRPAPPEDAAAPTDPSRAPAARAAPAGGEAVREDSPAAPQPAPASRAA